MITFSSDNIPMPSLNLPQVERWIRAVAAQYGYAVGDLNYIFCNIKIFSSITQFNIICNIITTI